MGALKIKNHAWFRNRSFNKKTGGKSWRDRRRPLEMFLDGVREDRSRVTRQTVLSDDP